MRGLITLVAICTLMVPVAGCGTSDSEISQATVGTGGSPRPVNPNTVPVTPTPNPAGDPGMRPANMTEQEYAFAIDVFNKTNEYRMNNGRAPLTWNMQVASVAQVHTQSMENAGTLTHSSLPPNPPCATPPMDCHAVRLTQGGVAWTRATENVARGQISADEVMNDWRNSAGHNANLLDPNVTQLGVGVRLGANGPWWTQNFISP